MYTQYIQRMPRLGEKEINKKSLTLLGVLPKIPFSYIVPFIDFFLKKKLKIFNFKVYL